MRPIIIIGYSGLHARPFLLNSILPVLTDIGLTIRPISAEYHLSNLRLPSPFPSATEIFHQLACDYGRESQAAPAKWRDFVRYLISFRKREPLFLPPRKFRCVGSNTGRWKARPRDQRSRRAHTRILPIAITLLLIVAIIQSI